MRLHGVCVFPVGLSHTRRIETKRKCAKKITSQYIIFDTQNLKYPDLLQSLNRSMKAQFSLSPASLVATVDRRDAEAARTGVGEFT